MVTIRNGPASPKRNKLNNHGEDVDVDDDDEIIGDGDSSPQLPSRAHPAKARQKVSSYRTHDSSYESRISSINENIVEAMCFVDGNGCR